MNGQCDNLRPEGYSLRPAIVADAEFILSLRLDPKLSTHISKTKPNLSAQRQWLLNYLGRNAEGAEYYFILEKQEQAIGTCRFYDIEGGRFTSGSWLIRRGEAYKAALASLYLAYDFAFLVMAWRECHFDVRIENSSSHRIHRRLGCELKSTDTLNHYYRLTCENYQKSRRWLERMLGLHELSLLNSARQSQITV